MTATAGNPEPGAARATGGVQSIERAFGVLEHLVAGGAMGVSELAARTGLPLPTIHRLTRTLVNLGYARQDSSRRYAPGPRLLLLADGTSGMLAGVAQPYLAELVELLGETANLAILDGDRILYVAQAQSRHAMRMFTEIGRRVLPHATAVGKALLAAMPDGQVRELLARTGMPRYTDTTLTEPEQFLAQLGWTREHGYALDAGEQEVGVKCVAVPLPAGRARLAISISGPEPRMSAAAIENAVPILTEAGRRLAAELA